MKESISHHDHSYSQITKQVYLGYNMRCCELHFQKLLSLDISADINVEAENVEDPTGMDVHLWIPTPEHGVPTLAQITVGAHAIQNLVENKKKVYVHCEKGHARSVVIVAAFLMLQGLNPKEALTHIKEKRTVVHPGPEHLKALKQFEKYFKKLKP